MCQGLFFNEVAGLSQQLKKETLAQMFSCEFCDISKNTFFTEHFWKTASEYIVMAVVMIETGNNFSNEIIKLFKRNDSSDIKIQKNELDFLSLDVL